MSRGALAVGGQGLIPEQGTTPLGQPAEVWRGPAGSGTLGQLCGPGVSSAAAQVPLGLQPPMIPATEAPPAGSQHHLNEDTGSHSQG